MSSSSQFSKFPEMTVRFNNPRLKDYILTECKPQQKIPETIASDTNSKKLIFAEIAAKGILYECNVYADNLNTLLEIFNKSNPKPFWPPYNSIIKECASLVLFLVENTLIDRSQSEIINYAPDSFATAFVASEAILQLTLQYLLTSGHEDGEYLKIDNVIKQRLKESFAENRIKIFHAVNGEKDLIEVCRCILWQSLSKDWAEVHHFFNGDKLSFKQSEIESINIILTKTLITLNARTESIYDELESVFYKI